MIPNLNSSENLWQDLKITHRRHSQTRTEEQLYDKESVTEVWFCTLLTKAWVNTNPHHQFQICIYHIFSLHNICYFVLVCHPRITSKVVVVIWQNVSKFLVCDYFGKALNSNLPKGTNLASVDLVSFNFSGFKKAEITSCFVFEAAFSNCR